MARSFRFIDELFVLNHITNKRNKGGGSYELCLESMHYLVNH